MGNVVEWPDEAITEKRANAAMPLIALAARIDRLAERAARGLDVSTAGARWRINWIDLGIIISAGITALAWSWLALR